MRYLMLATLALAACSGDTDTTVPTDTSETDGTTETGTTTSAPTFQAVYDDVLKPSCAVAGCHSAGSGNGMELTDSGAYAALVNAPSGVAAGEVLVIPNDADGSYLIKKLEGAAGILGTEMPPPFGGQDADDIQMIRDWIDAGANP
ncbi:MAG: hypothetical protein H6738_25010 [Alphaproteobacteria bacterium]|nr:hypothetical protein [Alphaproteobacteria bacterium]